MKNVKATQNQSPHTDDLLDRILRWSWGRTLNYSDTHVEGSPVNGIFTRK